MSVKKPSIVNLGLLCIAFSASWPLTSALAADAVPAANKIDWSAAGVQGGIPFRTTVYQTLGPSSSASQIQTAVNNCPSGQVVVLSAGTYSLSSQIKMSKDGVTLRGSTNSAGEPTTILNFASAASGWGLVDFSKTGYPMNNWGAVSTRNVTGGLTRGSTSVTLDSAPSGLSVGQMMVFDQTEDGNLVTVTGSVEGGDIWGRNGRFYMQFVKVTSINGSTVNFEPAIYGSYWNSAQSPQIYWFGSGVSQIVVNSGLEDVKINRVYNGNGSYNTAMGPAMNCWLRNVWSTQCSLGHIRTGWTLFCEVRDCYFTIHDNVASASYAAYITYTSGLKLENNIMTVTPCAIGLISTSGSVVSYNFTTNFPYSQANWLPECVMTHGGHVYENLFEGNFVPSFWSDYTHGNASFNTYVRNRVTGWEPGKTGSTVPIQCHANQDNYAVVGNVLGTAGYHTSYNQIYNVDPDSLATMLRKGNWNTANNAVPASESLGGDTIANSYVYSSKPAWFGDRPWPLVDPNNAAAAIPMNIPAGYRYYTGSVVPTGPPNLPPVVVATANPKTGDAPLNVNFSSTGSSDPESKPLTYSWVFGDGATSTSANPSHSYVTVGNFTAKLTVSDGVNSTSSTNITIAVTGTPPVPPQGLHIMTP